MIQPWPPIQHYRARLLLPKPHHFATYAASTAACSAEISARQHQACAVQCETIVWVRYIRVVSGAAAAQTSLIHYQQHHYS
jgi:hypothetical protein